MLHAVQFLYRMSKKICYTPYTCINIQNIELYQVSIFIPYKSMNRIYVHFDLMNLGISN